VTPTAVVLVGLMGAGKSTVARIVGSETGRRVVDSDDSVEASTGQTVRELWEAGGEASYRTLESAAVLDAVRAGDPVVVAAPGGAVLDPAVREALRDAFVVWLRADPAVLATRVRPGDHRPLLGEHPAQVLAKMAADRSGLYGQVADAVVDVDRLDSAEAARLVLVAIDAARRQPDAADRD
jgi:shikimate kinase